MVAHHDTLPRYWIGLTLLVWGVFTDQILLGVGLALVAEIGNFVPFKWDLTDEHFYRVADLTSVFFAIIAVYQFNEHSIYGIYRILALLPVCIFPLLVAERYSTKQAIPLSALFLSLRRRVRNGFEQERLVGTELPFMLVCVLAASAGDVPQLVYLASAFAMILGGLFGLRTRRYKLSSWIFASIGVAFVAFSIQAGVRFTQAQLEDSFAYWFNQYAWFRTDPNRERTAIGTIGRLKLSDRIRVRVHAPLSSPLPITLHEASYSKFKLGTWSAPDSQFTAIDPVAETTVWQLGETPPINARRTARIVTDHVEDVGVAPTPYGTTQIFGDELIEVQLNQYATTLVEALPGQLEYNVTWSDEDALRPPPTAADLSVPDNYAETIEEIAGEIGLRRDEPDAAMAQIEAFFKQNFKYSLIQKGYYPGRTPLAHFLLKDRKGHCEYFATAAALLLREAGIPSRYAVGYVVDEYSALEQAFVARARHAHSWAEAYVDNRWVMLDTTPSVWFGLERANASNWQYVQDLWSWLSNRYYRFQRSEDSVVDSLIWFVPPLSLWLFWRLRSRVRKIGESPETTREPRGRGLDSELYRLCDLLCEHGFAMHPGDTLKSFLRRNLARDIAEFPLERLLDLHYRHRFARGALSSQERAELCSGGEKYCAHYLEAERGTRA